MDKRELVCPRDAGALTMGREYGIEVDRCPACKGAWYDAAELALLEATVTRDEEQRRGTIEFAQRRSVLPCPVCGAAMRAFNYRAYNLELDACPHEHGFWLDAGEADRVRTVIQERVQGLARSARAEEAWAQAKRKQSGTRGGGGVLDQLRGLFRGR
jgi:Zn-finger nucleic acid-binding protein